MNSFDLHLQSATQYERVEGVTSFGGQDASGAFGVLSGHERMMTLLRFGLARYRREGESWTYLAVPGAVVYFAGNRLFLNTRRYVRGGDYEAVRASLRERFEAEENEMREIRRSLQRLEEEMFKRLVEINRGSLL